MTTFMQMVASEMSDAQLIEWSKQPEVMTGLEQKAIEAEMKFRNLA